MKMRSVLPMRVAKYGYIIVSIVFCIVGLLMMLLPVSSLQIVGYFVGLAMMIFGVIKIIGYFSKDLFRLAFQYDLEFGILLLILGAITLTRPGNIINFICISMGICFIAESLFKIRIALQAKSFGIRNWWMTVLFAVAAVCCGLVLIFRPTEAIQTTVMLLGAALLVEGALNLSIAISFVKIVKHQMPDVIESEYIEIQEVI